MDINNEEQARDAVASWATEPLPAQLKKLQTALESLELGQMYYEQKGNEPGQARVIACQNIIRNRLAGIMGGQ